MNSSYNNRDLANINNKYQMTKYDPNNLTSLMNSSNLPQYVRPKYNAQDLMSSSSLSNNRYNEPRKYKRPEPILNSNNNMPIVNNNVFSPKQSNVSTPKKPLNKEPIILQNLYKNHKEELLKESEKVFDDIELYGLILTNSLLKIRRIQQKIEKNEFLKDFILFRKKLYKNVDKTGDNRIKTIKDLREDFKQVKKNIIEHLNNSIVKNKDVTNENLNSKLNKLQNRINEKNENLINNIKERHKKINEMNDVIHAKLEYQPNEELNIDWKERIERKKKIRILRELIKNYDKRIIEQDEKLKKINEDIFNKDRVRKIKHMENEIKILEDDKFKRDKLGFDYDFNQNKNINVNNNNIINKKNNKTSEFSSEISSSSYYSSSYNNNMPNIKFINNPNYNEKGELDLYNYNMNKSEKENKVKISNKEKKSNLDSDNKSNDNKKNDDQNLDIKNNDINDENDNQEKNENN